MTLSDSITMLTVLILAGTVAGSEIDESAARVSLETLDSAEDPIYHNLWSVSEAIVDDGSGGTSITVEMQEDFFADAVVTDKDGQTSGARGYQNSVTVLTEVLNPRYAAFAFGPSSFDGVFYTDGLPLRIAIDKVIELAGDTFEWKYDSSNRVVNVVEKPLAASTSWYLNAPISGTPLEATDSIAALRWLAKQTPMYISDPPPPIWESMTQYSGEVTVSGSTVREAFNSVLAANREFCRFVVIQPMPKRRGVSDMERWLEQEGTGWEMLPYPEGLSWLLTPFREGVERMDFKVLTPESPY